MTSVDEIPDEDYAEHMCPISDTLEEIQIKDFSRLHIQQQKHPCIQTKIKLCALQAKHHP